MSAAASSFFCVPEPAAATRRNVVSADLALLEKLLRAVVDDSLYESAEDERPSIKVVVLAARILGASVLPEYLQHIEIDPGSGALDVTWRNRQRGRRVKASFGPNPNALAVYHEQKDNGRGRVTDHALIANARLEDLNYWVRWCYGDV